MEDKFAQHTSVTVVGDRSQEFESHGKGMILTVYSESQARKFGADYHVVFSNLDSSEGFDMRHDELKAV